MKRKSGPKPLTIDDYIITDQGDIYNAHTGKKLKPRPNDKGYLRICVYDKMMFVHRLVAEKYVPNPENKQQVNHIDGNKLNNCADNLEWVTNKENRMHAMQNNLIVAGEKCPWAKLNLKKVEYIREHTELNSRQLAEMFSVSVGTISDIRNNRSWK